MATKTGVKVGNDKLTKWGRMPDRVYLRRLTPADCPERGGTGVQIHRNPCPGWPGIGVQFAADVVVRFERNTQPDEMLLHTKNEFAQLDAHNPDTVLREQPAVRHPSEWCPSWGSACNPCSPAAEAANRPDAAITVVAADFDGSITGHGRSIVNRLASRNLGACGSRAWATIGCCFRKGRWAIPGEMSGVVLRIIHSPPRRPPTER